MIDDPIPLTRELARVAKENGLAEIDYRGPELRVSLVFEKAPQLVQAAAAVTAPVVATVPVAPKEAPENASAAEVSAHVVRSPLAGVFYTSPRPGAPPFISVGATASVGQTLCIVEAMKLMNEIAADCPMRILKILVDNGTVVASDQALFEYEPVG